MAFFEAYALIAGHGALATLSSMLLRRGLFRRQGGPRDPRLRRAGLGQIRTPEARELLQKRGRRQGPRGAQRGEPRAAGEPAVNRECRSPAPAQSRRGRRTTLPPPRGPQPAARALRRAPEPQALPVENATVQKALDDLQAAADGAPRTEGELEIRLSGEFIFVNGTRLRLELDNYASFSHILAHASARARSACSRCIRGVERREWQVFLSVLLSRHAPRSGRSREAATRSAEQLERAGVTRIEVEPPLETEENLAEARSGRRRSPSAPTRRAWRSPRT